MSRDDCPVTIFFPEIIVVAVAVLASPWWCYGLMRRGHYFHGGVLLLSAVAGPYGFFRAIAGKKRWLALLIIWAFLGLIFLLEYSLPKGEFFP